MKYYWETTEQRIKRFMKISPKAKLEWLREMNEFSAKFTPKKSKKIKQILKNRYTQ